MEASEFMKLKFLKLEAMSEQMLYLLAGSGEGRRAAEKFIRGLDKIEAETVRKWEEARKEAPAVTPVVDPIARPWNSHVPALGWRVETGVDAMNVLASLACHLAACDDGKGEQLLARLWRPGSRVLQHIIDFDPTRD